MSIALLKAFDKELQTAFGTVGAGQHFASGTAAIQVLTPKPKFDLLAILRRLVVLFDERQANGRPSQLRQHNWTWDRDTEAADKNKSEVLLERRIVQTLGPSWANMIPTASGTYQPKGLGRISIDLAERRGDTIEFFELKINSDNPPCRDGTRVLRADVAASASSPR